MGRRRKERPATLRDSCRADEVGETQNADGDKGGFFACYLLTSLSPRHKGHTYIGFTVNPKRRIRQHNGELRSGAWRTKSKRPWEMVLCIYGFPTNVSALQFEWAWQHPTESLAVRKAAVALKSLRGLASKIKLVYTMLTLPSWQSLPLTVNFFSTKYTKHSAGCPGLPGHMKVQVSSMEDLPCYTEVGYRCTNEDEDDCDHDEGCDKSSDDTSAVGITDMTVESHTDQWKIMEEEEEDTTNDQNTWPEQDSVMRQPEMLCSFTASSPNVPSVQVSPELCIDGTNILQVVGASNVFEMDQPLARMQKSTYNRAVDDDDQAPTYHTIDPCEADKVIDLLSPPPTYRIRSNRRKQKVSADHMKIQVSSMEDLPCYAEVGYCTNEVEDDGDHDKGCDKSGDSASTEGITDMTVESHTDQWKIMEEEEDPTNDQKGWSEKDSLMRQSGTLCTSPNVLSLYIDETDVLEVVGVTNVFEIDQPRASMQKPTYNGDINDDQASTYRPIAPCEAHEVIDLLSPSPVYRRKRKVSAVCPKIIDLTSSPILV